MENNIDCNKYGYIYKLCISDDDSKFYIGSTNRNINQRLAEHKYDIRVERGSAKKYEYFKNKIDDLKIIVLETLTNINTKELKFRERYYIDKYRNNINLFCPIRLKCEIELYNKIYYYKNREKLLKQRKETVECPNCKCKITLQSLYNHKKSKRCFYLKKKNLL